MTVAAGASLIGADVLNGVRPPPAPHAAKAPAHAPTQRLPLRTRSAPSRIEIPAIDVAAPVISLGDADNGAIDVPPPNRPYLAGWYKYGATPGQLGRTVIVGHLDSRYSGPAVFYRLHELRPGDEVTLTRHDGIMVEYRVDRTVLTPRDEFPAADVYGPSAAPELRLITCGGTYTKSTGWTDNVVVYGHITSWHHSSLAEDAPDHVQQPSRSRKRT
ncbi:class F sortase [Actinopolymorpha sp. NPDC004070]|uniref:class F sortase n=1 Tax=Actinopolymorpha sp. NPDC004070 TaxID=3154548 RepID=UPI0033A7BCB0